MKFKSPFWSRKEDNKAVPILYGKYDGKTKLGATGTTDNHLIAVSGEKHQIIFMLNAVYLHIKVCLICYTIPTLQKYASFFLLTKIRY